MKQHLTEEQRNCIQTGLKQGQSFTTISKAVGMDKSTISREVKRHRMFVSYQEHREPRNVCVHRDNCDIKAHCHVLGCVRGVRRCRTCSACMLQCRQFEEELCPQLQKAPYVCNGCKRRNCPLSRWRYDAKAAQKEYQRCLVEARSGIALSDEELEYVDSLISPLLRQGISIPNICQIHKDKLHLSQKTLYAYLAKGMFSACSFDLRRKVQRRLPRKKSGPVKLIDCKCREGRTYEDFQMFLQENPSTPVVQMDTVQGSREGTPVLLTLLFVNCGLQLMYLLPRNTAASVTDCFHDLHRRLGPARFKRLFPVILTDRGSEFSNPSSIETDPYTGELRTHVFFCDPQRPDQKSECERNHEFIRYVVPKGKPFAPFGQDAVVRMMNHINSYTRESLQFKAPMDLFAFLYGQDTLHALQLERIPDEKVLLRPELMK